MSAMPVENNIPPVAQNLQVRKVRRSSTPIFAIMRSFIYQETDMKESARENNFDLDLFAFFKTPRGIPMPPDGRMV